MLQSSKLSSTRSLFNLLFLSLFLGCSTPYEKMNEVEKAKLLTQLRKEADVEFARFKKSEEDPDGVDFEALKRYVELHRKTTEIAPNTCPLCFAKYGEALGFLAGYYRSLVGALEAELKKAPSAEKPTYQAKIKKYSQEMVQAFQRSNRQFEVYFNSGEAVLPVWYWHVAGQYEVLRDFRRALYYLDLYAGSVTLNELQKREVDDLRRSYREQQDRKDEEELLRELDEEKKPETRRGQAEMAN